MNSKLKLILASKSERRIQILNDLGIIPDVVLPANINENIKKGEKPRSLAIRLANEKATHIYQLRKNNIEYLIDIKTVQLNAGGGPKFNHNLLNWYAYAALRKTKSDLKCLICFPYNPHDPIDYWRKEGGKVKPLIPSDEALVGDEFWDFLSGMKGTTKLIFNVFKKLGEQDFGNKFDDIFNLVN